ncbi:HEPN domain-containing protein [Candidatus Azambacteria bacterium]|nr:HEPN domain-containing protein [Candidatus Azambacteria bacterium]
MNEKEVRKLTKYWLESSKHDYDTMISLFESKRFSDALFYGHIVLEKILKALIIKNTKEYSKPTHNLLVLTQDSKVDFNKDDLKFLAEIFIKYAI